MRGILNSISKSLLFLGLLGLSAAWADEAELIRPYDESADAVAQVADGFAQAKAEDKLMLISFGANWCPDCRAFDTAIHEPGLAESIAQQYVVVKVDVGNWDKNIELIQRFGNPIAGGIPSIVVADADKHTLYATEGGQLASARSMSAEQFSGFFKEMAKLKYAQ